MSDYISIGMIAAQTIVWSAAIIMLVGSLFILKFSIDFRRNSKQGSKQ